MARICIEPSPIAQGLAFLFAALFGWRVSFYGFMWDARDYRGAMTSDADMRRARRRHLIGSIATVALSAGVVYALVRSPAEDAAAIGSLLSRVGGEILAGFDALTVPRLLAWAGGVVVAGFGALIVTSNWARYWYSMTRSAEEERRRGEDSFPNPPFVGRICLLAGGAVFGEPVSTWLGQGWWALVLFADIQTDWTLVWLVGLGLGFGDKDDSNGISDAERAARQRTSWIVVLRVGAVLAAIGMLPYFEQSWIDATVDRETLYLFRLIGGCIFALLAVTSAGIDFLKFVFGTGSEGATLVSKVLPLWECASALLIITGSFANRTFPSGASRALPVTVVAKHSGPECSGMRRFAYRVELTSPDMRGVTLPISREAWQEMPVGEIIQVLATPGLFGLELVDASLR